MESSKAWVLQGDSSIGYGHGLGLLDGTTHGEKKKELAIAPHDRGTFLYRHHLFPTCFAIDPGQQFQSVRIYRERLVSAIHYPGTVGNSLLALYQRYNYSQFTQDVSSNDFVQAASPRR